MNLEQIEKLVFEWSQENISKDFTKEQMSSDIALFGLNSIEVVELCEHLTEELGFYVEEDLVMDLTTLNDVCQTLHKEMQQAK